MDPKLTYSLAKFAFRFCNELDTLLADSGHHKTIVCSPLSAEIVLAMVALGCMGQTRAELMQALDVSDNDALRSSFAFVTSSLQTIKEATLSMANKVYVLKGYELKPEMKEDVEQTFQSSLEQVDFMDKEVTARVINKWVEENTNGLIKDIVNSEEFDKYSRMVLINAIYFKGNWNVAFDVNETKDINFHVNSSTTIQVPMMHNKFNAVKSRVIPELKAKILEMEYKGQEASMVIVLPDDIEGLKSVVQQLAAGYDLMADVVALQHVKVNVMIPKFKVETKIKLKDLLEKLGIKTIFDSETAQISMLRPNEPLVVSEAVQKAFIVVDETGTEAAAVTAINIRRIVKREKVNQFIADRPFLYLLTVRGIPLFVGVYGGSHRL